MGKEFNGERDFYGISVSCARHPWVDPFVLASPMTRRYYRYAAHFGPDLYPDQPRKGVSSALASEALTRWNTAARL